MFAHIFAPHVFDRHGQTFSQRYRGLPVDRTAGKLQVGHLAPHVVAARIARDDARAGAGETYDRRGELLDRYLVIPADVEGEGRLRRIHLHKAHQGLHRVAHPAQGAYAVAGAVNLDVAVVERMSYDARYHASVVDLGARAIGVVYACHSCVDAVLAYVGAVQRLGRALGFAQNRVEAVVAMPFERRYAVVR